MLLRKFHLILLTVIIASSFAKAQSGSQAYRYHAVPLLDTEWHLIALDGSAIPGSRGAHLRLIEQDNSAMDQRENWQMLPTVVTN